MVQPALCETGGSSWLMSISSIKAGCVMQSSLWQWPRVLAIQAHRSAVAMLSAPAAGEAIQELANGDGPPPPAASHTPATHAPTPGSMPVAADSGKPPAAASKPVAADSGKPPAASSQAGSAGSQQVKPTRTPAAPSTADVKPASKAAAEAGGAKRPAASEAKPSQAKASAPPPPAQQAASATDQHPQPARQAAAEPPLWSEEQELALVQALKQVGKDVPDR